MEKGDAKYPLVIQGLSGLNWMESMIMSEFDPIDLSKIHKALNYNS